MRRVLLALQLCGCALASPPSLHGQAPADANLEKLAAESRARAEMIEVKVSVGDQTRNATVHPTPLMKYTDVPRQIEMATLWVWHDDGRPVALGKVEAYHWKEGPKWLYCFTSASAGLVDARWPGGRHFRARKPGVRWTPIDGPAPHETAAGRLRQMKELFQRLSATARDEVLKTSDELRALARPLHEYSSPKQGVLQGILCGFAANGTNPDVVVALEAVTAADGKNSPKSWRYGVVGMTASGISVKLDKAEVYTRAYSRSPGEFDTWTYFREGESNK
jgi:hypothetical protein